MVFQVSGHAYMLHKFGTDPWELDLFDKLIGEESMETIAAVLSKINSDQILTGTVAGVAYLLIYTFDGLPQLRNPAAYGGSWWVIPLVVAVVVTGVSHFVTKFGLLYLASRFPPRD